MDIKYPEGNVRANGIVLIGTKVSVNERERISASARKRAIIYRLKSVYTYIFKKVRDEFVFI